MMLMDAIYQSITEYPSLFYHKATPSRSSFEISRLAVLEHLFFVTGNGYAWVDGYLCSCEKATGLYFTWPEGWRAKGPKYDVLQYRSRLFPPLRKSSSDLFAYEYHHIVDNRPPEYPFSIYPLGKDDLWMPRHVQPDWLIGAEDIYKFAIEQFSSGEALDGSNRPISEDVCDRSIRLIKRKLLGIQRRLDNIQHWWVNSRAVVSGRRSNHGPFAFIATARSWATDNRPAPDWEYTIDAEPIIRFD